MIHLTPDLLEISYERLRLTLPFRRWKLPPADDVLFSVLTTKDRQGDYCFENGKHHIRVSHSRHMTLAPMDMTLAHEMCHLRAQMQGERSDHGALFNKAADQVCRHHGYDRGQF